MGRSRGWEGPQSWHIVLFTTVAGRSYLGGMGASSSRTRQRLREIAAQCQEQLDLVIEAEGPLLRGSFGQRLRACGDPTCHCARGELHESSYLTASDHGKVRQVHVPVSDVPQVAAGVADYRRFRRARTRLARLAQKQLELVDDLGNSLLKAYPPENPLPPPQKRGRPPKGGRHASR